MARSYSLEEIVTTPGMYFNPQTEVLIVVDDSAELDGEIFNMEEFEGADWVMISDETPIDEHRRDELLEALPDPLPPRRRPQRQRDGQRARGRRPTTRRTTRRSAGRTSGPARRPSTRASTRTPNASARIT